jgi:hypothetical protein
MRLREPRSFAREESDDRLSFPAMISGNTHNANVAQKISAQTGPPENGKGRMQITRFTTTL